MFQMCLQNQKKKSLDPDFIYLNFQSPKIKYEKPNGLSRRGFLVFSEGIK